MQLDDGCVTCVLLAEIKSESRSNCGAGSRRCIRILSREFGEMAT